MTPCFIYVLHSIQTFFLESVLYKFVQNDHHFITLSNNYSLSCSLRVNSLDVNFTVKTLNVKLAI